MNDQHLKRPSRAHFIVLLWAKTSLATIRGLVTLKHLKAVNRSLFISPPYLELKTPASPQNSQTPHHN